MKNRGYTLLELLGVIVILALLTTLVFPSILNTIKKSSNTTDDISMNLIENAADLYIENHSDDFVKENGNKFIIELEDLFNEGNLPSNIKISDIDDINDKCVQVTYDDKFNYELKDACEQIVSNCKLISGDKKTPGSKYECEVKPGTKYNFFVLSQENNGTINLILDRNINSDGTLVTKAINVDEVENGVYNLTSWYYSYVDNSYGPVTAIDFLHNATKDWINIPNIKMNYEDEGNTGTYGYGNIITTNNITKILKKDGTITANYTNLKARMPYLSEVEDFNGSNDYLFEYLYDYGWKYGANTKPTNHINYIYGYWILSTSVGIKGQAQHVDCTGIIRNQNVDGAYARGIRPVINVRL